jgi:ribonuclease HI
VQFFDGGSRSNPGPAGCGACIYSDDDGSHAPLLATASAFLGVATSNEAEYQGLILGLKLALDNGAREVSIHGDSKLVVNQVLGQWQARNHRLARLLALVNGSLLPRFDQWRVQHVYREGNKLADELANEAMDSGRRGACSMLPSESL